jgi:hypothetical protein
VYLCVKSTRHPWRCTPTSGWATLSSWTRSIWSSLSRTSRLGESSCIHCPQVCQSLQRRVCVHKQCTLYSMPQCRYFLALYVADPLFFRIAKLYAICIFHSGSYAEPNTRCRQNICIQRKAFLVHRTWFTVLKVYNRNI